MTDKIDTPTLTAINIALLLAVCTVLWGLQALTMIALAATPVALIAIIRLTLANDDLAPQN
jgi:hypothetical protein